MAVSFPRLPRWLRGGGGGSSSKEREKEAISKGSSLNPSSESSSRYPPEKTKTSMRKTKRGWVNKDEERIGNAVFPQPGGPEWSIGWVEPHGPGFKADDDGENDGFVVLVPCYKKVMDNSRNQIPGAINGLPSGFYPDGKIIEEWLSSLQKL